MNAEFIEKLNGALEEIRDRLERLEGTAPAGSLPASGCRNRGAVEQPGARQDPASAPPLPDQGTGALQMAIDTARQRAANWSAPSNELMACVSGGSAGQVCELVAAEIEAVVSIFEGLCGAPRPQSDRSEGESCRCEDRETVIYGNGPTRCGTCEKPLARGAGMERSGSGNAGAVPSGDGAATGKKMDSP